MKKEDLKIGQAVTYVDCEGKTKEGIFKGAVDYDGDIQATIEYPTTQTTQIKLENVTLK